MSGTFSNTVKVGRLTRDAELKYTNGGTAVSHFCIATDTKRKKGDQWIDEASFWDIELWGKQAENLNQYLTKGKLVGVEGQERIDRWEQDGQTRQKVLVTADHVTLLGSREGRGEARECTDEESYGKGQTSPATAPHSRNPATRQAPDERDFSDDIPF